MAITMFLFLSLLILAQKHNLNNNIISQQIKNISDYKMKLSSLQQNLFNFDLYKFKEKVMTKKYPRFSKVSEVVYKKCSEMDIDPLLILGIIQIESAFDPYAVSSAGAYGLMQINYSVWKNELNIDRNKIFDTDYNIELGITILKHYLSKTNGNVLEALHLYNNGYFYNNTKYKYKVIATDFLKDKINPKEKRTIL
jgi:soluble lytic murein transglycosylase-like protein